MYEIIFDAREKGWDGDTIVIGLNRNLCTENTYYFIDKMANGVFFYEGIRRYFKKVKIFVYSHHLIEMYHIDAFNWQIYRTRNPDIPIKQYDLNW